MPTNRILRPATASGGTSTDRRTSGLAGSCLGSITRRLAARALGIAVGTAALGLVAGCATPPQQRSDTVTTSSFGTTFDGRNVDAYTLTNRHGAKAVVITYGATLTELYAPDAEGVHRDIVLGFADLASYEDKSPYFGATIGRNCNRIANGKFTLDGVEYELATNNGDHHLHGGQFGFDKQVWNAEIRSDPRGASVTFTYRSEDGEEGYPGNLDVAVTYTLTDEDDLILEYEARTDAPTVCNLTHHSYFNLAGEGAGTILDHELEIASHQYTPTDETLVPTGELANVAGTAFDFTAATRIGSRIDAAPGGYDANFVLTDTPADLELAARAHDPSSGRFLEVWTTEPGLQFYTGNFLDGSLIGKSGRPYVKHGAFCLEPQKYPDSINQPGWPSPILRPGQVYRQTTVYRMHGTPED